MELDPLNAVAQGNLGLRCLNAGLLEEAAAALNRALKLNPRCGLVHWALGTVYLEQGRPEEALGAFQREEMESLRLLGVASAQHARGQPLESAARCRELVEEKKAHRRQRVSDCTQAYAYRGEADFCIRVARARVRPARSRAQPAAVRLTQSPYRLPGGNPFPEENAAAGPGCTVRPGGSPARSQSRTKRPASSTTPAATANASVCFIRKRRRWHNTSRVIFTGTSAGRVMAVGVPEK